MAYEELHVEIHYEGGGYWAHVRELPGCFATGDTLGELTEALESNVALYLTPTDETAADDSIEGEDGLVLPEDDLAADDDYAEVPPVKLHILELVLRLAAERPLIPALNRPTANALPRPPRNRAPHDSWFFRNFHRRGET